MFLSLFVTRIQEYIWNKNTDSIGSKYNVDFRVIDTMYIFLLHVYLFILKNTYFIFLNHWRDSACYPIPWQKIKKSSGWLFNSVPPFLINCLKIKLQDTLFKTDIF